MQVFQQETCLTLNIIHKKPWISLYYYHFFIVFHTWFHINFIVCFEVMSFELCVCPSPSFPCYPAVFTSSVSGPSFSFIYCVCFITYSYCAFVCSGFLFSLAIDACSCFLFWSCIICVLLFLPVLWLTPAMNFNYDY